MMGSGGGMVRPVDRSTTTVADRRADDGRAVVDGLRVVRPRGSSQAAVMLQLFVVAAFVFPSDTVVRIIGAQGYLASLIALVLFLAWAVTALLGLHDPIHTRYPIRGALGLLWICTLLSYAAMPLFSPDATQRLSADRWILLLLGMSGVILVAAEHLRDPTDLLRVIRTLVWGAAFSGVVAVFQFWFLWDLKPLLRLALPGFEVNSSYGSFQGRDALVRVTGTSIHPIELGVTAGMLLPLAIWLGINDTGRSPTRRWLPVGLIGMCIPMSVSRSAILAVGVAVVVFAVCLPARQRVWLFAFAPVAVAGVFATTPGYLRTILNSFTAGTEDASITNRLDNYPRVVALVREAPWLGRGGGTFLPADATRILDNQYFKTAIEMGIVGLVALVLYFLIPAVAVLQVRARAKEPELRSLCAALAGACLAAALGAYTFDGFSFAQFASVHAVVVGLCATCWLAVRRWPAEVGIRQAMMTPTTQRRTATPLPPREMSS
ncbi:O-antigen ligase family protein [Micromonospora sp. WMMD812]|uniref:O-antigen ligase family protein n=1 Tax=Micromonospora sp. WMMD812 TaxID=3015152 RepID=UPI00248BC4AE|nr:O-antigen ligase family protein [Micromonospora sp. WMMD812]WBB69598.1 O-antigen ligase family protein [Micromonospora sp. WMMD812]